jgi:hypothetical protein
MWLALQQKYKLKLINADQNQIHLRMCSVDFMPNLIKIHFVVSEMKHAGR